MGRILLVRHAQASLLSDDYDLLSPLGRQQSQRLGAWFAASDVAFDASWCGTLRRQRDTAALCLAAMDSTIASTVDPAFDEYRHEELFAGDDGDVATHAAISARVRGAANPRAEFQRLMSTAFDRWVRGGAAPGRRSWSAFRATAMSGLERAAADCGSGKTALVVSSGGAIAAMVQALTGIPDNRIAEIHWVVHNASVTRLLCQPGRITLSGFNSIAHFEESEHRAMITFR